MAALLSIQASPNLPYSQPLFKGFKAVFRFIFFICLLLLSTSCESKRTIVNQLDEKEANEILVFLSTRGIDAAKVPSATGGGGGGAKIPTFDISVDEDHATEAMALLNQVGLPRRRAQNLLGIFANVGLVPSEMQDKIRYQAGLAEQIASTIRKIDGVLDAEVQISFPEEDPLNPGGEKKQKITASVYVKHNGVLDDPNSHLITKIKRLVAASVVGLDFDNVTVIADRARMYELPPGIRSGAQEEEKQYKSIWSIVVAQESLFRFRLMFFTFTLLILFFVLAFIWIGWKIYPLLKEHGGFKELFHFHAVGKGTSPSGEQPPQEGSPTGAAQDKGKNPEVPGLKSPPAQDGEKGDKGLVDEDIDET
jgi:type III secretion protein J